MSFGLVQSPPDPRDWRYASVKAAPTVRPKQFFYPKTPLRDQGPYGTCVGFGAANLKDIQELSDSGASASALFIYRRAKTIDGLPATSDGTTLKAALTILKNEGVCTEREYPYHLVSTDAAPPVSANTEKGKISAYARCYTVDDIKNALLNEGPVLIGMGVSTRFRNLGVGIHHITTLFGDVIAGGHCMLVDGYDDLRQSGGKTGFMRVKNSWADWGDDGYFWLAYDVVTERSDIGFGWFMEAWSAVDLKTGASPARGIKLRIGASYAEVNGVPTPLDSPAVILNNRTMVPIRFVAESFGKKVLWDHAAQEVTILET